MVASQSHEVSIFVRLLALNLYSKGIQYCYPCDMWLRSTCWEDHLIGKFHKKNTDKKKKHKLGHHKFGKKRKKNENKKKMQHKKRSVHKKAGLPVPPLWICVFLRGHSVVDIMSLKGQYST